MVTERDRRMQLHQMMLRAAYHHWKLGETRKVFPPGVLQRAQTCLDFGCYPRSKRNNKFLLSFATQFMVLCYNSPKNNTISYR
jgi:hypothetical protein